MALPNEPLTRSEQYLNRIATDSGTIPDEPLTRVEQYLDYIAKNGGGGSGGGSDGGGSGGGVLMVTDNGGVLDKTMGEIQDAYLSGKRVILFSQGVFCDVISLERIHRGRNEYVGCVVAIQFRVETVMPSYYRISAETEEAARNAYPAIGE